VPTGLLAAFNFDWDIFLQSVFTPDGLIIGGVITTVVVAVISQVIGVLLGVFAALGRMSRFLPFRWIAAVYIWIFRGTPLLVQIAFFYFGLAVAGIYKFPDVTIGDFTVPGNIQAGILALGVNEGAYMSEIVRAGILSIDRGQMEAARSLGMTYGLAMRRIVLPQAARVIIPPLGNEFNNMLKTTSLLVIISVQDIYGVFSNKNGSGSTAFRPFELFLAAAVWYLLLTTIWGFIQARIERHFSRGAGTDAGGGEVSFRQRLFGREKVADPSLVTGGR
jgi:polar amino acid transport system permease protein